MTEMENRFRYHAPDEEARIKHQQVTDLTLLLAETLDEILPESRGKSLAITKLEEARMWANQSIATHSR